MSSDFEAFKAYADKLHEQTLRCFQSSCSSLNSKMDKLVRQLDDVMESQKKMNKTLVQLSKAKPAPQLASEKNTHSIDHGNSNNSKSSHSSPPPPAPLEWAKNVLFIGDETWNNLEKVAEVRESDRSLELMCREGEIISNLYDATREKLLFAVPPNCSTVAIAVGRFDLLQESQLLTLRQASLDTVRKTNKKLLQAKLAPLKSMIGYLISQAKRVVLVIPPLQKHKIEVFQHWEKLLAEEMGPPAFPGSHFRMLNLPEAM